MFDPYDDDPLSNGAGFDQLGNDPDSTPGTGSEPMPHEPHEEWRPSFVSDFTARTIENSNPFASEREKRLAAQVADGRKNILSIDDRELDALIDMNIPGHLGISPFMEQVRRERNREPTPQPESQFDPVETNSSTPKDQNKEALNIDLSDINFDPMENIKSMRECNLCGTDEFVKEKETDYNQVEYKCSKCGMGWVI